MADRAEIAAIKTALLANVAGPKSVTVDGNRVDQHSVKDLMDALKLQAELDSITNNSQPFRVHQFRPV